MDKPIKRQMVLVVDDTPENITVISEILQRDYRVKAATTGERALAIAASDPQPDLILLDVMMPHMDGNEVCRRLKANPQTAMIPVIFVTALNQSTNERIGFDLGAVDYISKPVSPPVLEARVRTHLALHYQNLELERKVRQRTAELNQTRLQIIRRLGRAAEYRDNETGLHVIRMSHYTRLLAEAVRADNDWVDLLFNAAPMHDIGKIGIPDQILTKPAPLTPEERLIIQRHPQIGADILGECDSPLLELAHEVALTHHEQWNGKGYPQQLAGEAIPISGRIAAIADVFDALTTPRPYKKAWSFEQATDYITTQAGSHFDPQLTTAFLAILPAVHQIHDQYREQNGTPSIPSSSLESSCDASH